MIIYYYVTEMKSRKVLKANPNPNPICHRICNTICNRIPLTLYLIPSHMYCFMCFLI